MDGCMHGVEKCDGAGPNTARVLGWLVCSAAASGSSPISSAPSRQERRNKRGRRHSSRVSEYQLSLSRDHSHVRDTFE